jgi:hypothetical protein
MASHAMGKLRTVGHRPRVVAAGHAGVEGLWGTARTKLGREDILRRGSGRSGDGDADGQVGVKELERGGAIRGDEAGAVLVRSMRLNRGAAVGCRQGIAVGHRRELMHACTARQQHHNAPRSKHQPACSRQVKSSRVKSGHVPVVHPLAGHEGQMAREASSCATTVITNLQHTQRQRRR